ncbi:MULTISPECIES: GGDEF domain-containing protein [unclassified Modicisalibacter]|uniref:sensor domain-containing diguanylate cyclase n=1 Tax=unclassified Modicisalibacter TaxID=2679913 RepID=UPI001CCEDDF6|nr:HDOD domain-containing protein [Modicisalibacter sp. R2A 31.J]MBZ9575003.1 HDOD domain-containing protein [Modicisalibacter sp. MOD 31.J]
MSRRQRRRFHRDAGTHDKETPVLPDTLSQSLERCSTLPSLPTVVMRVIELARAPDVNTQEIVTTLGSDPALSARLLSLANTVIYAGYRPAEDLSQAVHRVGLEGTLSMALGCSLVFTATEHDAQALDLERYWQRSLIGALIARSLAESLSLPDSGALFTAALLQDIGILALHASVPARYRALHAEAGDHRRLVEAERQAFGVDHAMVGAWLAERWGLSQRMRDWIAGSHDPLIEDAGPAARAANCIIAAGGIADGWLQGEAALSLEMAAVEACFSLDTESLIERLMGLQEQLPGVANLYDVAVPERLDPQQLMLEAKMLLAERNAQLQQDLLRQRQELEALRREHAELAQQARRDALTGLANRLQLEEALAGAFDDAQRAERPLSLVFIDLDRFKAVNDQYGHAVGDEVLRRFGALLAELTQGNEAPAGRYGGEEFVVLLGGCDTHGAQAFAERLRARLAVTPLANLESGPLFVTASYGIATQQWHAFSDASELLRAADAGMYQSKQSGCDRVTVHPGRAPLAVGDGVDPLQR